VPTCVCLWGVMFDLLGVVPCWTQSAVLGHVHVGAEVFLPLQQAVPEFEAALVAARAFRCPTCEEGPVKGPRGSRRVVSLVAGRAGAKRHKEQIIAPPVAVVEAEAGWWATSVRLMRHFALGTSGGG